MKKFAIVIISSLMLFTACADTNNSNDNLENEIATETEAITEITTETIVTTENTTEMTTEAVITTENTTEMITEAVTTTDETNPIISKLVEKDIRSGSGGNLIGKYLLAKMPESDFTDDDLIGFYNYCKENESKYLYIIIDFDNGEGIWYSSGGSLNRKKLEFDKETGSGYIQHESLGYYKINDDNTVTYLDS